MTVIPLPEGRASAIVPSRHRIFLEDLAVDADIGFHDFEVGAPQRLLVNVDVGLDLAHWPDSDTREASWNYDFIREGIIKLVASRRFNLQETLAESIFAMIAARPGVISLRVSLRKPDVYPDARSVGVLLSSD
jgi:dihydroneopterin aldolase